MYPQALGKCTTKFIAVILIVMLALAVLPAKPAMAADVTDTYSTPGTFTWTAPTGVTSVTVEVWGGGGRGQSLSSNGVGGGGGGGAYSSGIVAVSQGTGYTVVVGAGSSSTSAGGDSYFSTNTTVMAKGGSSSTSSAGTLGGAASSGFGSTKFSGGTGGTGSGSIAGGGGGSAGSGGDGGNGGAPTGGTAGSGGGAAGGDGRSSTSGNGTAGNAPGAGGGGAYRTSGGGTRTGGSGASGKVLITYTYPAPTIGTVTVSPDSLGYTSTAPTITASVTSAVLPTCEYTTDGTTWVAGAVTGSAPSFTCTGSPTGRTGPLILNIRATNGNGTTTGGPIDRTVDSTGPTDGSLTVTPGNAQNGLSWTAATDSESGLRGTNTYVVRFLIGATPPTCSTGTSIYTGTALSSTHSSLTNGTQYSYRVCSYDGVNNASIGATGSGTPLSVPTMTSPTAIDIYSTTATLGANVTSNGGGALTARGMCWGINPNPSVPTNCTQSGTTTGIFTQSVTSLTAGTKYYYRGYATNSAGTGYSPEGSFYTEPATQATLVNFTSVTGLGMTVNWTRGSGTGVIVLMKAASAVDSNPVDGTFSAYTANAAFGSGYQIGIGNYVMYMGTGSSVPVTGLVGGTTYYVAVYEYAGSIDTAGINQGTNYKLSPATNSQLIPTVPPTVTTNAATSIKSTSAILHGTVNANNSSTAVTFEYGLTTAYGTTVTAFESPVIGAINTPVSYSIPGGLTPLTTYHFRVVGLNGTGIPVYGLDASFTTAAVVPLTFYVNNTVACSDSNPGTVPSAPFCTIDKGATVADAGDTVSVLAGTYAETVQPNFSGGPGNLLTFTAAPGVTITGAPGNSTNGGAFRLYNKGYIVIDGFTITGTADYGIYASYSNNLTISDNHVSNSGSVVNSRVGIYLSNTTYSTISGNTTDHNYNDGIRLKGNSNYNTVSNNISFGNAVTNVSQATGINFLGSSYNTVVHNITYANEDSGLNFYDGSSYNQVIGNLTYGNGDHGIDNNGSPYNTVIGNTVHGNVTAGINFEASTEFGTNSAGAVISSNVCVDNGYLKLVGGGTVTGSNPGNIRVDTTSATGTTLDYDMVYNTTPGLVQIIFNGTPYYSMAEFLANSGQEAHGLEANPLFTSPAPIAQRPPSAPFNVAVNLGNYHIAATSPAIDSGNSNAPNPSTDLDGNPRVDVSTVANTGGGTYAYYDRGAYEYQPAAAQTITITSTAPVAAVFGGPTYTPTATATSGLPVAITVDATASTVCSITGGVVSFIGVGNCVLDFNQAGNLLWSPAPQVQETFAVAKAPQTITVTTPAPVSAAYNASFTVAATASSTLPVTYSATGVCTNVLGVFTMTSGTGTCTVHYNQAGDANRSAAPEVTEIVNATKLAQTISVGTHAPVSAGYNSSFTVAATSSSTLAVTYSPTGVCTNVLGVFTMTSPIGTCTVHYNQAGDANYDLAPEVTELVTATKGTQTITVSSHAPVSAAVNATFTVAATASSTLPVTYSASGVCTNALGVFTMTSATGICTVHYNQAGDANYDPAPEVTETVNATNIAQTITVNTHAPLSAAYNSGFTVAATSSSGLPVAYSVTGSVPGVCTISGATVTMTSGTGICTIHFNQAGNSNYAAAPEVTEAVSATKLAQSISVTTHAPAFAAYNSIFTVTATASSGLSVAYSASGICTSSGADFTMTSSVGTCTVHYNQAGDVNYDAALEITEAVTASKSPQTISITTHAPLSAALGESFVVAATSSSLLPVAYSASGVCTNVGATFTMTSAIGTCTVHFNQAGDSYYAAAPEITAAVSARASAQTITVTLHAPTNAAYNSSFTIAATASSGFPVAYSITTSVPGVCTITGATVTMTSGTGICSVHYNQAGDSNFAAAPEIIEDVSATKLSQTVTFTSLAPSNAVTFGPTYTATALATPSGLPVAITVDASASSVCHISGGVVSFTEVGTCVLNANQAGNNNYSAALQVQQSFEVEQGSRWIYLPFIIR